MPRRASAALAIIGATILAAVTACGQAPDMVPVAPPASPAGPVTNPSPARPPGPPPGHEVYGFLPYWEMDGGIAAHLRTTRLTTLALFSVTNTRSGALKTNAAGYRQITGSVGAQVIREAQERGVRVELVFSSFGLERNARLFEVTELQDATIASLVGLVAELGLDGVNVDVEALDPFLVPAYGAFVGSLRAAVTARDPSDQVSAATQASLTGAAMAAAAAEAGADRLFLMGYDYRVAGSAPGAIAPIERRDDSGKDLPWSLDLYATLGVPVERTLLGLPLYGRSWPVTGPELAAPATGRGASWIPRRNLDLLRDPAAVPLRDQIEMVELYALDASGAPAPRPTSAASSGPGPIASAPASPDLATLPGASPTLSTAWPGPTPTSQAGPWRAVYVDSPETLAWKLALANERGLAGAGFWAIGYERGLPAFTDLIARFAAGEPMP